MTARGFYTLFAGAVLLVTALSVGSAGALLLGCAALLTCAFSLCSVLLAYLTCRLEQDLGGGRTPRGLPCRFRLSVRLASVLPIAPLGLRVMLPSGRQSEFSLAVRTLGETASDNEFACPHVGVYAVGVTRLRFRDCFGLFSLTHRVRATLPRITVLPNPAEATELSFSPGEGETTAIQRANADRTTPSDTRAWQEGDELKRVHWKLSMRRQELMVRTYETPQRADALILLDCAVPDVSAALRASAVDALTESCAGVIRLLLDGRHPVRLPLGADGKRELSAEQPHAFAAMQYALAKERFDRPADFARTLFLAARRVRRTGAAVILTTTLTPAVADAVLSLRRTGPHTRFLLFTEGEMTAEQEKLLHLLAVSGVDAAQTALR